MPDRGDVVGDVVHRVVDRHAGVDGATRAVDVQEDVGVGVLRAQQQELGADRVGVLVAHLRAEEDDALAQQALVDVVVEAVAGRAAVHLRKGLVRGGGVVSHGSDPRRRPGHVHGESPRVRPQQTLAIGSAGSGPDSAGLDASVR